MEINPLIWSSLIFWCLTVRAAHEEALIYGSFGINFCSNTLDVKNPPVLIACPASKTQEMKFNEKYSISGESLFVQNVCKKFSALKNLKTNVCKNPIKPVTFYDMKTKIYEIGYELYNKDGQNLIDEQNRNDRKRNSKNQIEQIEAEYRPQDSKFDHYVKVIFHRLAMPSKHPNDFDNIKYQDKQNIKFKFFNGTGNGVVVFHFIPVWYINVLDQSQTMKITLPNWQWTIDEDFNPTGKTCKNYRHLKDEIMDDLYSEANQKKCLEDLLWIPASSLHSEHTSDLPCGQPYGCLKKSQIVPDWYSNKYAIKLTFCTCMNFVPVWDTIAEKQLKKVELLVFLIINAIRNNWDYDQKLRVTEVNFGVSGTLKMKKKDPEKPQEVQLWDGVNEAYTIPVPKIIFKIIRMEGFDNRSAIIIVHNDPTPVPDSDRICTKESEIAGWDIIKNDDPRTGLTYVCHLTVEIIEKLELEGTTRIIDYPLNLEGFLPRESMIIKRKFEDELRHLIAMDF